MYFSPNISSIFTGVSQNEDVRDFYFCPSISSIFTGARPCTLSTSVQAYRACSLYTPVLLYSSNVTPMYLMYTCYVYFCPSISSMFSCAPLLLQCTPMYLMLLLYTCHSQNGNVRDLIITVLYLVYRYPRVVKLRTSLCL